MTDLSRPVIVPITELVETLVNLGRAGLSALDESDIDRILVELNADTVALVQAGNHEEFCDALRRWGEDFVELVAILFGGLAVIGADVSQIAIAEVLRSQLPRLGAVLSLAGVIVDHPIAGSTINFEALRDFLVNPPGLINETFWDETFAAGDIEGTGRLPAMLIALLLLAPATVSAMRRGELRLAPLEPPPVADPLSPWGQLRANSTGWIPITFPLRRGDGGRLVLEEFADLGNNVVPGVAMSVLIRSQRRSTGAGVVTDFEMWIHPGEDAADYELRTGSGVVVRLTPGVRTGFGYDGEAATWNAAVRPDDNPPANEATLLIRPESEAGAPGLDFGPPYDTRIAIDNISAELRLQEQGEPSVEVIARVDGLALILTNRWFRSIGFGGSALREGLRLDVDLALRIAEGVGFEFAAEGGLATRFHINKQLGNDNFHVKLHSLGLFVPVRASEDHFDIRAELRAHWSATIGPATLVMDGAGGWVGWWADEPGADKECVGLLPPTGLGLQLALPGVTAGGFLDFSGGPNDSFGGVLTVSIGPPDRAAPFSVTAFGVHELLGDPGASDRDRSFVIVLGVTFSPGWPVGWGLNLVGAGGLYGWRRRASTDALRERLTSGAVGNVLFADDPVRNAPVLLGDIAAIFPPARDVDVFGLTLRLSWLAVSGNYFVKLAVGVIIEYPHPIGVPSKIIVLGSANAKVPGFPSVLEIQIDVVGIADIANKTFELDATIRKGTLLKVFTVSGDAAVRASWGARPYLMTALGGFHPDFHPEPAIFPRLAKLRLALDKNVLPKGVKVSGTLYLAITTNSIQFGAQLDAQIKLGGWSINGLIGGDVLVQLPFLFDIEIRGQVSVRYRGFTLASLTLTGALSGPNPTVLRGEVCFEAFWTEWCFSESWQLSNSNLPSGAIVQSLVPLLVTELALAANLRMTDDADELVRLEPRDGDDRLAFAPRGRLIWEQNRVPLGLRVQKIEGDRLADPQRVTVKATQPSVPTDDWFGIGQFVDLSLSETLALPAFERHQAGLEITLEQTRATPLQAEVDVTEIRIPGPQFPGGVVVLPDWLLDGVVAREGEPAIRGGAPRFAITDPVFAVNLPGAPGAVSEVDAFLAAVSVASGDAPVASTSHPADRLVELAL